MKIWHLPWDFGGKMTEHDQVDVERPTPESGATSEFDSVYLNSIRETRVLLIGFVVFLGWTIGSSMLTGYGTDVEIVSSRTLGMPSWVFWSVLIPWIAATLFTFWFAWFYMANDSLVSDVATNESLSAAANEHSSKE